MASTEHRGGRAPEGREDAEAIRPTSSVTHDGNSMSPSPPAPLYSNGLLSRGSNGGHLDDSEPRDGDSSCDVLKVMGGLMDLVGKDISEKADVSFACW